MHHAAYSEAYAVGDIGGDEAGFSDFFGSYVSGQSMQVNSERGGVFGTIALGQQSRDYSGEYVETAAKEEAQAQATAAENEANRVFYAIGSNKELKQKGLLSKKFLGATKVLKGDFDASYFVTADKRTLKSIPTNAKKVKIWTNMPAGSYTISGEKDGPKTIEITNPAQFWSLTSHLIIQTD